MHLRDLNLEVNHEQRSKALLVATISGVQITVQIIEDHHTRQQRVLNTAHVWLPWRPEVNLPQGLSRFLC